MSSATKASAAGLGVLVALALALAWVRVDAVRFNPGDRLAVTAEVGACGRMHVEAGGERWSSNGDWAVDPSVRGGTTLDGTLLRSSENEAALELDGGAAPIDMGRVRPDRFVTLGCMPPDAQS